MELENLSQRLWEQPDEEARRRFLTAAVAGEEGADGEALVAQLKEEADRLLRADIQRCLQVARLMLHVAHATGDPRQRALGLLAEANARALGLSEYQAGIDRYNEAGQIYARLGSVVEQAQAQIGKVWPLAALGRYEEALETGNWAAQELEKAQAWLPLAKITGNMAAIHGRMGQDRQALAMFDRARDAYRRLDAEGRPYLVRVAYNRAIVLRNLGRFDESIRASKRALALAGDDQRIDRARAQQSLATTYFVLGRVNEALQLLDEVRAVFLDDGRKRDAILVELFISDCLLQLRRFRDVLDKCAQVRRLFRDLGTRFEVAQAILNEAVAFAGLEQYEEARASLQEARALFDEEGNDVWLAFTDLELATISVRQGALEDGGTLARRCAGTFAQHDLSIPEAQSWLVAARAASGLGQPRQAQTLLQKALAVGRARGVPLLVYQARHLLGTLAAEDGDPQRAMAQYDAAMETLEQLRGRMMVEFRADFLEDKGVIYEDAVQLCLQMQRPEDGLDYAERAKSRALLDLLAYRLDVGLRARREEDEPLVAELSQLRAERDRLYRRWESGEGQGQRGWATADDGWQQAQQDVLRIERRITELWHRLLIHNADYAQEAALWQVRTEPVQPYLDDDTLLLEYFVARGELLVFLVTAEEITVKRLPGSLNQIQQVS
jgi:tetratricopeptide (TPR) repeat protein